MTAAVRDPRDGSAVRLNPSGGPLSSILSFCRRKPLGAAGGFVFFLFLVAALIGPLIAPFGVNETNLYERLRPPSATYWLGTDQLGRDVLSRVLVGAQTSIFVAILASALATFLSTLIGTMAGYFGGRVDLVSQRFVDAWMIFPDLILLIVVISVLGPGLGQTVVVLGLLYGIAGSRIIRGAVMSVRENVYVKASQAMGAGPLHIIVRHVLPNIAPVVILLFTARIGAVILAEAGLSFLGLGIPPPAPTWGGMLSGSGRSFMYIAPWLALAPGLCLTIVVYAINVFGDALRDVLDPRMRGLR
jgi:peptide/nickel transport system permease protein